LHVLDSNGLAHVAPLQMQAQGRYRGIKRLNDMQRLDLNRRFELMEELLDAGERWAWHKRAPEQILFLAFNLHLANLPLLGIYEINDVSYIL
jgi:hypothetical protein